jgi:hypothetical protein
MAFGIALRTTAGLIDIGASVMRSARLINSHSLSGKSGSRTFGSFDSNKGFFHVRLDNNSVLPPYKWNNSTKTFSWDTAGFMDHKTTPQFSVYLFRTS